MVCVKYTFSRTQNSLACRRNRRKQKNACNENVGVTVFMPRCAALCIFYFHFCSTIQVASQIWVKNYPFLVGAPEQLPLSRRLHNRPFYNCVLSYLAINASKAGGDLVLIRGATHLS